MIELQCVMYTVRALLSLILFSRGEHYEKFARFPYGPFKYLHHNLRSTF